MQKSQSPRSPARFVQLAISCAAFCLIVSMPAAGQTAQPSPPPTPRRALAKPVDSAKALEKYAARDSSTRLIAGAATREAQDPALIAYENGQAAYDEGKYKEAIEAFREALTYKPSWVQAHFALALSLTETDKLAAIEEFKTVLKLKATDETKLLANYDVGNASVDLGQFAEAIKSYQDAIALNTKVPPPQASLHYNLGIAYVALDKLAEAVAEFNQTIQLQPEHAEAHFNLGVAYLQLKNKQRAKEQRQLLKKLNPALAEKLDALIKQ